MNTGRKVKRGRQQKATNNYQEIPPWKNLYKKPVQNNMPKKNDVIKKQAVDIIIATAENIKDRNKLDNDISFQVVPVRIAGTENT